MSGETPWLSIVGIGEDGYDGLNADARDAIASAAVLYGGARHLALVPEAASAASRICWPSPMSSAVQQILREHRGKMKITVLASGDPMLHGIGVTMTRDLARMEFRVIPQVSSFSLACARMGWPAAETALVSLVNRPMQHMLRHLFPGQRLVVFSENGTTPASIADLLTQHGYGASSVTVFESIGGPSERTLTGTAAAWPHAMCASLNLVAVVCTAGEEARLLSLAPGLADSDFNTDGQLTKREVRSVSIARLAPLPNQTLWDVGAGNGSIGIEWMRVHASCACIAFELREDRAARIRENADRLGVPNLRVIHGPAPQTFADLPAPDAIFLGGSVAADPLFSACWEKLRSGGRMVANAVTLEAEASMIARHAIYGGDLMRMAVSRAEPIGRSLGWRAMMPITQWTVTKP